MAKNSYVRFFHAADGVGAVDIYINDRLVKMNLMFSEITQYLPLMAGAYNVKVFPIGDMSNPVINTNIRVPINSFFTIPIILSESGARLYPIADMALPRFPFGGYIRYINLSKDIGNTNFLIGENTLFTDISYSEVTNYLPYRAGSYTFKVVKSDTKDTVLVAPNQTINRGLTKSVYLIGNVKSPLIVVTVDA